MAARKPTNLNLTIFIAAIISTLCIALGAIIILAFAKYIQDSWPDLYHSALALLFIPLLILPFWLSYYMSRRYLQARAIPRADGIALFGTMANLIPIQPLSACFGYFVAAYLLKAVDDSASDKKPAKRRQYAQRK